MPSLEVIRASGEPCLLFEPKEVEKTGKADTGADAPPGQRRWTV